MFSKLLSGQPSGIFGIGYEDPTTVGIICTIILLILVVSGVRVVFAASIAGMIGLVELIGVGPALANIGAIPYSKSVTFVLGLLPIFILIGFLAYQAGMTRHSYMTVQKLGLVLYLVVSQLLQFLQLLGLLLFLEPQQLQPQFFQG